MAEYNYTAITKSGQRVQGLREAETREDVANFLHQQGLVVVSIDERLGAAFKRLGSIQIGGVPLKERLIFVKQLSTMLGAGLPIIQALDILVQQTENPQLKEKLSHVYRSVEAGSSLSEAFRKEKSMFTEIQISLLVAGERSGALNEVMAQIAIDLEKSKSLRSKLIGSLIYPAVLMVVMLAVLIMMIVFMIPTVKSLYEEFGTTELPPITSILISISEFLTDPLKLIIIIILVISIVLSVRYAYSTPGGKRTIDGFLLKVPVFGQIIEKSELTQFCRLVAMLLHNGVSIIEALKVIANSMSNELFKSAVLEAREEVIKGNSLSLPLAKSKVFPLVLVKMLATGEETGKLDKVTADMGEYYETELNELTANLTKLLEPFILLGVGGVVGFMAVAVYLPLYQLGEYIK